MAVAWEINWKEPRLQVEEINQKTALIVQVQVGYSENPDQDGVLFARQFAFSRHSSRDLQNACGE